MRSEQGRTLATGRRTQTFLESNTAVLGDVTQWSAFQALGAAIMTLTTQAANQQAGKASSVGETARQVELRNTLRVSYMAPVATIAKEQAASLPEATALRMPSTDDTVEELVAAANAMAQAVTANLSVFTAAGLPSDIATQLQTAAAAVTASIDTRAESRGTRTNATSALSSAEKDARSALRVLDSVVTAKLQGSPLLAQWKSVVKVSAKPGVAVGTTVPASSTPAVTPAASPATTVVGSSAVEPEPALAKVHAA